MTEVDSCIVVKRKKNKSTQKRAQQFTWNLFRSITNPFNFGTKTNLRLLKFIVKRYYKPLSLKFFT